MTPACDFKRHFCKHCGPISDCSLRSSLICVHTVCLYAKIGLKSLQVNSADDINRRLKVNYFGTFSFSEYKLRGLDTLSRWTTVKIVYTCTPFLRVKGVYSTRNELAPYGSKFFPFRVDPFQKGLGVDESEQEFSKVDSLCKNDEKSIECIQSLKQQIAVSVFSQMISISPYSISVRAYKSNPSIVLRVESDTT